MDAFADFFPDLAVLASLLLLAMALAPVMHRLGLPSAAAFLLVGVVAGAVDAIPTDGLGALPLEEIGVLALYAILLQGGLATGIRAWRAQARPILLLGLPGTAVTALALAAVAHYGLGLSWALAAIVGVALGPTDPAAVYSTLRGGGTSARARTVLEGESGFNDPVGISLMVVVVTFIAEDDASAADGVLRLVEELGIGLVGGVIGAAALITILRITRTLENTFQTVTILITAAAIGAATATLHGSGFLAVYITGLVAADEWAKQDGRQHAIPEAIAGAAEPILFGLLGAVFASTLTTRDALVGLALTAVTLAVVRPLVTVVSLTGSGFDARERRLVWLGGLKGAVPLLLAAYPALESLDEARRAEAIVLSATAASIVLQGLALTALARRADGSTRPTVKGSP